MLHVILFILKIIGIVLAALLGTILLILLLLLFVPIRYQVYAKKREEILLKAKVTWLLRILSVPVEFQNGELSVKIKVFGIPVKDLMAEEDAGKAQKKTKKQKARKEQKKSRKESTQKNELQKPESQEKEVQVHTEPPIPAEKTLPVKKSTSVPGGMTAEKPVEKKKKSWFSKLLEKIKNLKYTIRRFCDKIKRVIRKVQETKAFVLEERTKAALKLGLGQVWYLVRKLFPYKLKGEVHFGTDDPALTGEILGAIGIFYPLFMDNVKVIPDFEQACLEGEIAAKGKFRLAVVVRIAWKLFWDKNIRYVYQKLTS